MNRTLLRILFPLFVLATILAFVLALSPSNFGSAYSSPHGASGSAAEASGHHASLSASDLTPTPGGQNLSRPGSTTGLVIMSSAIALIILLPILFQKNLWTK